MKNKLSKIFIFFTITFLLSELLSRFYINLLPYEKFLYFASHKQLDSKNIKPRLVPSFLLGYTTAKNYESGDNKHNSLGFRGDEISKSKKKIRIVCLGGSTTYSSGKNYKKSYPYLLQSNLNKSNINVEVINAGVQGYNTLQSLINFETRVLDINPDMIIVYHGFNDLHTRLVWPNTKYKADFSGMADYKNFESNYSFLEKSTFLRIIMLRFKLIDSHNSLSRIIPFSKISYTPELYNQLRKGSYPSGVFKKTSLEKMFKTNSPIYFERNLQNIVNLAKSNNIKVILSDFIYYKDNNKNYLMNLPESQKAIEKQNNIIKKLSNENNTYFLNLKENFPIEKKYFKDEVHFTKEGNELRAKIISEFVLKNDILNAN